jgi:hypothetical protein
MQLIVLLITTVFSFEFQKRQIDSASNDTITTIPTSTTLSTTQTTTTEDTGITVVIESTTNTTTVTTTSSKTTTRPVTTKETQTFIVIGTETVAKLDENTSIPNNTINDKAQTKISTETTSPDNYLTGILIFGGVLLVSVVGIYIFRKTAVRKSKAFQERINPKRDDPAVGIVSSVPKMEDIILETSSNGYAPSSNGYAPNFQGYNPHYVSTDRGNPNYYHTNGYEYGHYDYSNGPMYPKHGYKI